MERFTLPTVCPLKSKKWLLIFGLIVIVVLLAVVYWPKEIEPIASAAETSQPNRGVFSGNLAVDFTLGDITGKQVSLSDFQGRPILLNFFATWCGPCKAEMPHMEKVWREYQEKGSDLVYLLVNVGESKSTVEKFFKDNFFTMPVVFDPNSRTFSRYLFRGIPGTIFIGRDGVIKARYNEYLSEPTLRKNLENITKVS